MADPQIGLFSTTDKYLQADHPLQIAPNILGKVHISGKTYHRKNCVVELERPLAYFGK